MKPKTITIELTEDEIKTLIREWAQQHYPGDAEPVVKLRTYEFGDRMDCTIGHAVAASVYLNTAKEK